MMMAEELELVTHYHPVGIAYKPDILLREGCKGYWRFENGAVLKCVHKKFGAEITFTTKDSKTYSAIVISELSHLESALHRLVNLKRVDVIQFWVMLSDSKEDALKQFVAHGGTITKECFQVALSSINHALTKPRVILRHSFCD